VSKDAADHGAGEAGEGIGRPVRRKEDLRFVTGQGRYTADLRVGGEAHVAFVRSPHAHARLLGIEAAAALRIPGVLAVLTGADMARDGVGALGLDFAARHYDGKPMATPPRYPLARGAVRYVGEPVALVVAESEHLAADGADAVAVDYAELPAVADLVAAADEGAPLLHPEAPGNVACDFRYGNMAEVNRAFESAAHVVTLRHINNRVAVNPLEPRAAIAQYDALERRYKLIVSHQTPFPLRTQLAECLHVPEQRLHVISPDVGGGFGVKGPTYPEEVALTWAAGRLNRPLRWVCGRSEMFLSDAQARDHVTTIELALDAEGRFLAIRVEDLANLGAYVSSFGAGPPIFGQTGLLGGAYRTPLFAGRVRMIFSNTLPTDAYRGPGRAECAYMLERIVDVAARELGIGPVDLRRRNMIPAASMPYQTPGGRIYDSGDFPAVFDKALALADHTGFEKRRAAAKRAGRLRGIGIAYYIDHTGMGPSDLVLSRGMAIPTYESALVRFNKDGGVTVVTGTHTHGQGLETALAQIVSDRLGIAVADIEVLHGDTRDIGFGRGTVGARSMLAGGAALEVAIGKLVDKGKRIAAHMLECDAGDVAFAKGDFSVEGTDRRVPLAQVARAAYFPLNYPIKELEPGFEESGYWDPSAVAFPNGCHVCEVEIDPDTGATAIVDFVSVDDFGTIINPLLVAGQVHGGIAQGIGQALREHAVYDAGGQIVTGSFMDYGMPRAHDVPAIRHETHPGQPCTTNPLGVKGCGEAGAVGAPPAVINAIVDALAEFGVRHIDMPATPAKIWSAIHAPPRGLSSLPS
jgi:carbon-monoxide dehydrogenase large subunit